MEHRRVLRVVVASPGDVQAERETLQKVIDGLNRNIAAELKLLIELVRWERNAYPGLDEAGPQGLLDPILRIKESDLLIGIFWKRFGTPTAHACSGTEHEIMTAYEAWQQNGRPQVMLYFNKEKYTLVQADEVEQVRGVLAFKQRFLDKGLCWEYEGKAEFGELVREHLTEYILHKYPLRRTAPEPAQTPGAPADDHAAGANRGAGVAVGGARTLVSGRGTPAEPEGDAKVSGPGEDKKKGEPPLWKRRWLMLAAAVAVVALAGASYLAYRYYWHREPEPPPPPARADDWEARFNKAEPLDEHWLYPKGVWGTEPGDEVPEGVPNDEALLVKGREMGIPIDLGGEAFYDFTASFKIRFKPGTTRVAWVLRAQADRAGGYLFELVQNGVELTLYGWVYELGKKARPLRSHSIPFGELSETSPLFIEVVAKGNEFNHTLRLGNDLRDPIPNEGRTVNASFKDGSGKGRWPYGVIGFVGTDDASVMKVEYVKVYVEKQN